MVTVAELNSGHMPDWCAGCGDFGILIALKGAMAKLNIDAHNTVVVAGIGCSGKLPHFIKTYGFEGLHGRTQPAATAIHLVNNSLNVVAVGGDGDGYGIGMGHFIHAMRRNLDYCYIVHNNEIYGLTVGQASPTTKKGIVTKSPPHGTPEQEVNPMLLSLSAGATFVARGFSGDIPHLTDIIAQGIAHRGIAHIDVFQPCTTWRKDLPYGFCPKFEKPIYTDEIPFIKDKPLVKHDISNVDISKFVEEFL